jgi:putative ABC transport system permease protein
MLAKNPGFTAVAVLAIALGIGANSAIFSVVNAVLLRPLPFKDPGALAKVWGKFDREGIPKNWISEPELFDLKEQCTSFEDLAAYSTVGINLTGNGEPIRVSVASVNASLFDLLGVAPVVGRGILNEEDQPGKNAVAVLGNGLWRERFSSDQAVVGRTIQLNDRSYSIVGVMPAGFSFPDESDLWIPLALDRTKLQDRGSHELEVLGRLRSGVSPAQAGAELERVAADLEERYPGNYASNKGWGLYAVPLTDDLVGKVRPALLLLLGAVAFVLLIACANVANLLLARATEREKELAVRAALGAGRGRLIRQLLTESVILAIGGGALGLVLAYVGIWSFVKFGPRDLPRIADIGLDGWVLAFSLLVSVATGLLFGFAPALHISRPKLQDSLREGGRGQTQGRHLVRNLLVISEVSLALVLLIGAGLMMKSFGHLLESSLGFRTDHVLTMRLSLPQVRYSGDEQVAAFYSQLLDRIKPLPGVQSAGAVSQLPLSGAYASGSTSVEDTSAGAGLPLFMNYPYIEADRRSVSPDYFSTLGIPLVKGRYLSEADAEKAPRAVVVDENFARRFWPGGDAIGKHVSVGQMIWGEIAGIVAHVKHYGPDKEGREQVYFPLAQRPINTMFLAVRTASDSLGLAGAVREQIFELDRDLPVYQLKSMEQLLSSSVAQPRLYVVLFDVFAAVALILAAVGIYGIISYSVTQRTNEIGIRMALGASRGSVLSMVIRHGLVLTGAGLGMGLTAAFALTRLMSSLLFGVKPTDPATFAGISSVLALVAALACLVPARRATKVDPMVALRYE